MSTSRVWIPLSLALVACGGTVVFEEGGDGGGGNGGDGGGVVSSAAGQIPATGGTTSTTVASSGIGGQGVGGSAVVSVGQGGGSSITVGPGSGGAGGGGSCSDLNYAECIGATDICVPQFDDFCCSSCFPGGCADCVDYRGVACIDRGTFDGGDGGTPPPGPPPELCATPGCGFVPDWACNGEKPDCSEGCFANPGCVEKLRCEGDGCQLICDGIAPDACSPSSCNAPAPQCGPDQIAEVSNSCWTGFCIPLWMCQFPDL